MSASAGAIVRRTWRDRLGDVLGYGGHGRGAAPDTARPGGGRGIGAAIVSSGQGPPTGLVTRRARRLAAAAQPSAVRGAAVYGMDMSPAVHGAAVQGAMDMSPAGWAGASADVDA